LKRSLPLLFLFKPSKWRKYGVISIESLRGKFKIKTLREDVTVNEEETLSLRKEETFICLFLLEHLSENLN